MPRVLISDKLSPAAVAIFKERGVEVHVKPGLDKEELAKIIGDYDGLAIRSATKVTAKLLERLLNNTGGGSGRCDIGGKSRTFTASAAQLTGRFVQQGFVHIHQSHCCPA